MFVLTVLEEIKKTKLNFPQGRVTVLWKMVNYQEARVKLTNTQLNKLKSAAKNKKGTISIINQINVENEELPHELFLTIIQKTERRNSFCHMNYL